MINKGLFSSNSNEWATPTDFYKELDAEFHFNLDPCSTHENAKCERHYTIDNDGLTQEWGGAGTRVFCNPPYGREIGKWVKKCYEESKNCEVVVMLIPARTDTRLISTTTSITRLRRYDLSEAVSISTIQSKEHRSRQW